MSNTLNNVKISLRTDTLANWNTKNPVLNNGEVAIILDDEGNQLLKIGNGISSFTQLNFVNEKKLNTESLFAKDISTKSLTQGYKSSATPLGMAGGAFVSANANFSQALGYDSETSAGHDYSFVWNGDDTRPIGSYYRSHGKGTMSLNPNGGLSGLYIGEKNLQEILNGYQVSGNYLTAHQSLSAYETKDDLTANYYKKTETSSATELETAFSEKSKVTIRTWED